MKILIVDDEPPARLRLKNLINDLQAGEVVAEAVNGQSALQLCQQNTVDIILLDIRMPGMDGIETAHHLKHLDPAPAVIFTTAYDDYALEAFDAHAIDYLLKPIRKERLKEALSKTHRLNQAQYQALQDAEKKPPTHISANSQGKLKLISIDDVKYFFAEHKYVTVHYNDEQVLIEDSLNYLEDKFPDRFIRIHRNALVAIKQVSSLQRHSDGRYTLGIKDHTVQLDISRRHLASVKKLVKSLT